MRRVASMTESVESPQPSGAGPMTAGALLRAAREQQGVHIAVLAAAIKISPRKLDSLEGDRYNELPDAAFTRALAQTVCRALKIDPAPVMALLPTPETSRLDAVGDGLNTPFKDRAGSTDLLSALPRAPLVWAALALLAAAALVYYWPSGAGSVLRSMTGAAPSVPVPASAPVAAPAGESRTEFLPALPGAPAASGAASVAASAAAVAATAPLSTVAAPAPGTAAAPAAAASAPVVPDQSARPASLPPVAMPSSTGAAVVVSEPVWLEVIDGRNEVVFQRTIQPGEALTFEQSLPLRLKIGNAGAAKLSFRGEAVDLAPFTRANVARVVLK